MKNKNDFESLISKISELYKTAQNSIPENDFHDWYIYIKPIEPDECPCDFCKVGERKHLIIEVIPDLDIEKIEEVEFFEISKAVCDNCLHYEVSLVERNLWEITFWENWYDEGINIVCLRCGEKNFIDIDDQGYVYIWEMTHKDNCIY
jgi:RNase P subunit RPR2